LCGPDDPDRPATEVLRNMKTRGRFPQNLPRKKSTSSGFKNYDPAKADLVTKAGLEGVAADNCPGCLYELMASGDYAGSLIHSPNVYDYPAGLHSGPRVPAAIRCGSTNGQPVNFDKLWMDERAKHAAPAGDHRHQPPIARSSRLCATWPATGTPVRLWPSESGAPLEILCEDGPVLSVNKPAGLFDPGGHRRRPDARTAGETVSSKRSIRSRATCTWGSRNRLDRPVSGVVVFRPQFEGRRAAGRNSFRKPTGPESLLGAGREGPPDPPEGETCGLVCSKRPTRPASKSSRAETPGGRAKARLKYRNPPIPFRNRHSFPHSAPPAFRTPP